MPAAWQYRRTSVELPEAASARVRALSAGKPVVGRGAGRRLRVPVHRTAASAESSAPVGVLFLRWWGAADPVTVYYLGWNPSAGGSEVGIRRAAVQLAGSLRAPARS